MLLNEVASTNTPEIIILVGLPGSGKSTYIKQLKSKKNYVVVSTDDIFDRFAADAGINYNQAFKILPYKEAEREMFDSLRAAVTQKKSIIVDQTNTTIKSRARKLGAVTKGYKKIAVVFSVDEKELQRRLDQREKEIGKSIPKDVIQSMKTSFQPPSKAEGFDEIIKV